MNITDSAVALGLKTCLNLLEELLQIIIAGDGAVGPAQSHLQTSCKSIIRGSLACAGEGETPQ